MQSDKILIFDIFGEYAHFRKFNTTSSPLTYSTPTPPVLAGMLGAVLGIEREYAPGRYAEGVIPVNKMFGSNNAEFGIQLLNPINKVNIGFNLLDTDKSASSFFNITNRTQIEYELLKDARFRIYLRHTDTVLLDELAMRLNEKRHHFTPYLGISQCTADLVFRDFVQAEEKANQEGDFREIITAVKLNKLYEANPVQFNYEAYYSTDTLPISMSTERIVQEYAEVLVEIQCQAISANAKSYWHIPGYGDIMFL